MKHEVYIKTLTCAICALEPLSHLCNWRGRLCLVFQCGCGTVQYSAVQKAACESLGSRCSLEIAGVRCLPPSVSCPSIPGEMTLLWQCWGDRGAGLEGCVGLTFLALWFPKPLLCCPSTKQEASKLFAKTRLIKPRQGNGCLLFLMYPKDPHALLETNLQYFILHMSLSLFNPLNN